MNKLLLKNIYSLSTVQIANTLFPLLTVPYLLRTVGIHNYGLIAFIQSIIAYCALVIDFGFNLSATAGIALERDNNLRAQYFWKTIFSKILLLIVCLAFVVIIVHFEPFTSHSFLFYLAFISLIGNCLFPNWYFQGIQKMSYIPLIQIPIRTIATILIFILVKYRDDITLAIFIPATGSALIGLIGLGVGVIHTKKMIYIPRLKEVIVHIRQSRTLFIGQAATSFFNESLTFLLGLFAGYSAVGIYASADKIINAITAFIAPISWAIYPQSGVLFGRSKKEALIFLSKVYRYGFVFFSAATIGLIIFAPYLASLISGSNNIAIATIIQITSPIPLAIFVNNIYGTQILINTGNRSLFTKALMTGALISILLSFALIPLFHEVGAGVVSLIVEICIALMMKRYCTKNNLLLSRNYA